MADAGPYFRVIRKFVGPAWLTQNGESELVGYTLDVLKDAFVERLRQGLLSHLPQQDPTGTPAADDALSAMGRDRRIVRGISETSTVYAARLLRWLDDWKSAGNAFALMKQLAAYTGAGPAFRTVDVRGNWYSLNADGTQAALINRANWDWDGASDALTRWSRFWVIIYPNGLWTQGANWGDVGVNWGEPTNRTWGSTATLEEVQTIRGIVSAWKPAGTRCVNIILAFDNTSFDPTHPWDGTGLPNGTWGRWSTLPAPNRVASRLSTARYWDGV